ncbi:MAG: hypothetical protein CO001_00925 [Candidatus Portnoybacteria bacterium CG_4_8_14_3_um_filter_40_10]|uniref:Uncharacterized protein n=4 Tax=Candidatus Portnoyibacteriota TaxID=1817913 RepID=A0A2M7IJ82_9BACT|nr:MAG: hypothetical protein COV84_00570 [Candidatus Portnoybacteria bacterium CG11_big_fil_rev_8_21_14_0_20_40_15]PIS29961.1 MAG: hypothetical protein COT41_03890 [Candidatus Portnoybacteria bacterium CG08_land_8_20_14_0_20_40_83]PIW76519.1 MAG: hypothetical protein CO001_00925 [Candidatus Portnoybacteria bacterium CG_4_8_14_3_um_filter_40_10]PIY74271.1 MAG: hypothetical protein COY85_03720 [Candidatus Portnoybacteria bacterium CG_4_10_14_0_8_um_filter_40_50]PJA64356.1 MAG: hypothetical protei
MSLQEETISNLISEIDKYSDFSDEDKNIWKERIKIMPPEYVLFLLDLFENSPEDIRWLNQNIKEKEKILENRDKQAWQKLLEEEKQYLGKLNR